MGVHLIDAYVKDVYILDPWPYKRWYSDAKMSRGESCPGKLSWERCPGTKAVAVGLGCLGPGGLGKLS